MDWYDSASAWTHGAIVNDARGTWGRKYKPPIFIEGTVRQCVGI